MFSAFKFYTLVLCYFSLQIAQCQNGTNSTERDPVIVNRHDFNYILNPGSDICGLPTSNTSQIYLVYVHTKPMNFKRRMTQRETWLKRSMFPKLRFAFMMGKVDDAELHKQLLMEQSVYNDIVKADFLDTYRNLSHKGMMAMKWIAEFCPHAEFIMKVDDDIVVNLFAIMRHASALSTLTGQKKQKTISVSKNLIEAYETKLLV
jgi:hypothetical protein